VFAPMIDGPLRCVECGNVWRSAPAARVAATLGGCLTCGGELVAVAEAERDRGLGPGEPPSDSGQDG
jgi:predicted  nucleic acid-binding Zn-ribbon protein